MITCELKGFEDVKAMFADVGHNLSASQIRGIVSVAGEIIAKEEKQDIELKGELGQLLKKDIGVYRDTRKSAKNAEYVLVGPRFRPYTIRNQSGQKVGLIAQHFTIGFRQTDRKTRDGQIRGRVSEQVHNFASTALMVKKNEVNGAIEKGVNKQLNKTKSKFPNIVK